MTIEHDIDKIIYSKKSIFKNRYVQFMMGVVISFFTIMIIIIPVITKKDGFTFFNDLLSDSNMKDMLSNDSQDAEAYHYWYAPENSFGISSTKMVNWSYFKQLFNEHFYKKALYKLTESSNWQDGSQYLSLNKTWNESGFWKVDIILDVPVDLYSVNISFGCDLPVLDYVERDGYEIWLNYSANATENYSIMFNWSDIACIPNLEIYKIWQDGKFWISFKRDNVSAGYYVFDPTFGHLLGDTGSLWLYLAMFDREYALMSWGSPDSSGTVDNITVNFHSSQGYTFECALYQYVTDYDAGSLIDVTEQKAVSTTGLVVFNFSSPPSIIGGTKYFLGARPVDDLSGGSDARIHYNDTGDTVYSLYKYSANGVSFDDPFTEDITNLSYALNIYASYTESEGLSWQTVNETNGSFINPISWQTIDDTVNGSFINSISWQDVSTTINGSFLNTLSWNNIAEINGSFINPISWNNIESVNGSFVNSITWQTITDTINGSFINPISWSDIETINGSFINSVIWQNIVTNVNGSFVNFIQWQTIDDTINGSFVNPSTNNDPVLSNEFPENESVDIDLPVILEITCTDSDSDIMIANWSSNSSGSWIVFASNESISSGDVIRQNNSNFSSINTTYYWRMELCDGQGGYDNETFRFNSVNSTGDIISSIGGRRNNMVWFLSGGMLFSILVALFCVLIFKKRKR